MGPLILSLLLFQKTYIYFSRELICFDIPSFQLKLAALCHEHWYPISDYTSSFAL